MVYILKFLVTIVFSLVSVAFLTLLERKILSLVGLRLGPNKVSFTGLLQPISDALKLANKSENSLINFSFFFYYLSSLGLFVSSIYLWSMFFVDPSPCYVKLSFFVFLFCLSLNCFFSIVSGWSTFGKFSLLGTLRTVAQLISYEASLYMCLFFFFLYFSSFSTLSFRQSHSDFLIFLFPPIFFFWIISSICELNRSPFDFSEGESELVSGFNTDFGSKCFTLIFLAEYSNIIFFSMLTASLFFLGGWAYYFSFLLFFFIWIRSAFPRFRFDKLMSFCWKILIPCLTLFVIFYFNLIF